MVHPPKPSDSQTRNPIESIASDFAESVRHGHEGSIDTIVQSNPEMEAELRDLLPVIKRLEKARQTHLQRPAGLATLGSSRPDRLGDYHLVRQIGRGGMGVVFEAVQESLGRKVAVKVLPKSLLSDGHQLKRFEQEARTAGSLHHTNIVPVFGVGEDQGFHYFVMQRIDGRGLDRLLSDDAKQLSPMEVAKLGKQAASALAYAHQQNVLHRDIKPANLIVNDQLQLWVTDFGVAKAIESEAVTRTGDVVGTLRYMAPEQIVGDSDVRSDIYSLGVTLYELLAGRPAMDDASIRSALVARRAASTPPRLRQLNPEVPRDLETILHTAMSIDASHRYQSAAELAKDLQHFIDGEPISVRRLSLFEIGVRWARGNPAIAALSALSFVLLASVAVLSTIGFVQVQASLDREQNTRRRAEANATLATGALDQIFHRFAGNTDALNEPSDFSTAPALSTEAVDLLEDLLHYYDELAARSNFDPKLHKSAVDARYAIGDIHFKLGNYDRAIEAFKLSLADSFEIAEVGRQRLSEARIRNRIGLAHRINGDDAEAEKQHQQSLNLLADAAESSGLDAAVNEPRSREIQFEFARTHYLLGVRVRPGMGPTAMPPVQAIFGHWRQEQGFPRERPPFRVQSRRGTRSEDRAHLQLAIKNLNQLRQTQPDHVGYALALAACLRQLEEGAPSSESQQQSSIQLLRDLRESHPHNQTVLFELSQTLADLDLLDVNLDVWQVESKIAQLEEAVSHFESLSNANPNVPKYTNAVAHTHFKLAVLLERLAEFTRDGTHREVEQQAGVSLRQAVDRYETLLRQHPEAPGYRAWHALFLHHQGGNALKTQLLDQAEQALQKSVEEWKRLIKTHPKEIISWHALPETYELLSHAQHRLGKYTESEDSMNQSGLSRILRDMDH